MSHDLNFNNGRAAFAFNEREMPWHRLGVKMTAEQCDADSMLAAAQADYHVSVRRTIVCDEDGQPLTNPDGSFVYVAEKGNATLRENADGTFAGISAVGDRYHAAQNRDVLESALAIVGAANGDTVVDTVGVLGMGEVFFATISLDSLMVEALNGVDQIDRYVNVLTSHNGKFAMTFSLSDIRTVCKNTVQMSLRKATRKFTVKHTLNGNDFLVSNAQAALNLSTKWAEAFKAQADALARMPVNDNIVTKVLGEVFPLAKDATERQQNAHDEKIGAIRQVAYNERNMGGVAGSTAWGLWNGIVEYLDHNREVKEKDLTAKAIERAKASMDDGSWVNKLKETAQGVILAYA